MCTEAYRGFESPLLRQQVFDITTENKASGILPWLPKVSGLSCASWPLRERISRALWVQRRSFLRTWLCQWLSPATAVRRSRYSHDIEALRPRTQSAGRCYCVRNLYATIRATMLAKISSAGRDFRIIGLVEWRAADRPGWGLDRLWNRTTLLSVVGVRAFGSGAAPTPPISL